MVSVILAFAVLSFAQPAPSGVKHQALPSHADGTVGFDNQIAAKMAHALAHSSDSHSRALGLNFSQSFRGHSLSLVLNLYLDIALFALNSNQRGFASRVTMNVCQAFLDKPEYEEFHFGRQSSEVVGNLQVNR